MFGRDYETPYGTCVRDYIHVSDLCDVHHLALQKLWNDQQSNKYNLGKGNGFSVQQIIDIATRVTGRKINVLKGVRRAGDPAVLVANAELAKKELGWRPKFYELETIVRHAWQWEKKMVGDRGFEGEGGKREE